MYTHIGQKTWGNEQAYIIIKKIKLSFIYANENLACKGTDRIWNHIYKLKQRSLVVFKLQNITHVNSTINVLWHNQTAPSFERGHIANIKRQALLLYLIQGCLIIREHKFPLEKCEDIFNLDSHFGKSSEVSSGIQNIFRVC